MTISANDIKTIKANKEKDRRRLQQIEANKAKLADLANWKERIADKKKILDLIYDDIRLQADEKDDPGFLKFNLRPITNPDVGECVDPIEKYLTKELTKNGFKVEHKEEANNRWVVTADGYEVTDEILSYSPYLRISWE